MWNVSLLPEEARPGFLHILNRDYGHFWHDPRDREDKDYPVVLEKDELCWKRDEFVMDALSQEFLKVDLVQLAMDPTKQWFRKQLYKRLSYSLKKYNEIFWPDKAEPKEK